MKMFSGLNRLDCAPVRQQAVRQQAVSHPATSCALLPKGYAASNVCSLAGLSDTVPRIHWKDLSIEDFVERFERPRLPVVITGLADAWPAYK